MRRGECERSVLAFRSVESVLVRSLERFLYELKAGPAARQRHDGHRGAGLTLHSR
jgi:hypothetical protein